MSNIVDDLAKLISYRVGDKEQSLLFNKILDFEKKYGQKQHFKCKYEDCKKQSIDSHEISRNIILKELSNADSNVFFLKEHNSDNSFRYKIKNVNIKGATTFPGYCKNHDNNLFSSIEDIQIKQIDSAYIHKQTARTGVAIF